MKKVTLVVLIFLFVWPAFSKTCKELISSQIQTNLSASALFNVDQQLFAVVLCKKQSPQLYDVFYTQLHDKNLPKQSVPSGILSRSRQPVDITGEAKSTGYVVKERSGTHTFTVRLRARLSTGEAIDISRTLPLKEGESLVFENQGINVGIVNLIDTD
ncbi:MAG: hypothetical protein Alis3KO_04170 [Aliiglaciecola sp.]|uniref:hypothetical protein n=1 Tax=Aliiglaciecola sp. M165 TaxID=2593649 RepID=UPI00117F3F7C|nr:hypothetical protein [Aliiglaciecola sp. M165]TRY29933.1 hypothetical protein FM019_17370 [Aliiglaciecola sp. M165]